MRERLSIVLSTTALAVAVLGATPIGEAALNQVVPRNSVGALQLKTGAVTNRKLAAGAVTGAKVRNRSLLAVDFRAGQLPAGPPGPAGPAGPAGPPGTSGLQPVFVTGARNSTSYKTLNAVCPTGKVAIGGGVAIVPASAATAVAVTTNYLNGTTTWATAARETTAFAGTWALNSVVICATVAA
jgi:hypothetical protein